MICEGLNPDVVTELNHLICSFSKAVLSVTLDSREFYFWRFMDYAISPCDFRSTKESTAETTHVVGSLNQVWTNSAPLTQDQLETLPPNHEKTWVFQQCFTARDNARWLHCGISTSGWHALWFHTHLCESWRKMLECTMKKKVHIICLVITLALWKFWRWLRNSYPGTEKGQWFTTSLE